MLFGDCWAVNEIDEPANDDDDDDDVEADDG